MEFVIPMGMECIDDNTQSWKGTTCNQCNDNYILKVYVRKIVIMKIQIYVYMAHHVTKMVFVFVHKIL